jgi:hypothetical protein
MKEKSFVTIFPFSEKHHQISKRKRKPLPHLDLEFSLVAFFQLVLKMFRLVLKSCHHLMLNPSWDASQ